MTYPPDPGGDFASDVHRRILAAVPTPDAEPMDLETLTDFKLVLDDPANGDEYLPTGLSPDDVVEVLKDLEAEGEVKELKDGWKQTKDGHQLLTGPPKEARE